MCYVTFALHVASRLGLFFFFFFFTIERSILAKVKAFTAKVKMPHAEKNVNFKVMVIYAVELDH